MYAKSTETMWELNAKNLYTNQNQPFVINDLDLKQLKSIKVKIKPKDAKLYFIQLFMPLFFNLSILISIIFC